MGDVASCVQSRLYHLSALHVDIDWCCLSIEIMIPKTHDIAFHQETLRRGTAARP
jgi:hypothetical protein